LSTPSLRSRSICTSACTNGCWRRSWVRCRRYSEISDDSELVLIQNGMPTPVDIRYSLLTRFRFTLLMSFYHGRDGGSSRPLPRVFQSSCTLRRNWSAKVRSLLFRQGENDVFTQTKMQYQAFGAFWTEPGRRFCRRGISCAIYGRRKYMPWKGSRAIDATTTDQPRS